VFSSPEHWIIPAVILGCLGAFLLLRLVGRRFRKNRLAEAEIDRIAPFFRNQSPLKTQWVRCSYSFKSRKRTYRGQCVLPLRHFLKSVVPPGPVIIYDVRINMPVLITDDARIVGEETIEHHLLGFFNMIRVRYHARDPAQNGVAEIESLRKSMIKNGSAGS